MALLFFLTYYFFKSFFNSLSKSLSKNLSWIGLYFFVFFFGKLFCYFRVVIVVNTTFGINICYLLVEPSFRASDVADLFELLFKIILPKNWLLGLYLDKSILFLLFMNDCFHFALSYYQLIIFNN